MLRRSPMKRKPSRGSGIPQAVRDAVLLRDGGRCRRCGISVLNVPASIHHRLPRGRGGDARLSGLILICGDGVRRCHGDVESQRAQAYDDGFLCRTGEDPAAVAVLTIDGWRLFGDDGSVTPVAGRRWEAQA